MLLLLTVGFVFVFCCCSSKVSEAKTYIYYYCCYYYYGVVLKTTKAGKQAAGPPARPLSFEIISPTIILDLVPAEWHNSFKIARTVAPFLQD